MGTIRTKEVIIAAVCDFRSNLWKKRRERIKREGEISWFVLLNTNKNKRKNYLFITISFVIFFSACLSTL